jgi:hypothetical protein
MIVNMTIRLADGLLGLCLVLDKLESFSEESRFLEITYILLGDAFLMAQFLEDMIILLFSKVFMLNLGHHKGVAMNSVSWNVLADRDWHGMPTGRSISLPLI